ncbi:tetratricopeptide repeat-containing sensor histidine kinase [Chitinophaga arvensicola]|uniref:histidine kinase n=1 Tax=Chitinophaga arvensicola TaxID=29529 RepID=A0A1I0S9P9_9BACT|nr:sensor histidine kinase [Chitinophaga arvensicola]SEW52907.1 Signal transduction histidine kinase [Chitinophaga arvensicola]
MRRYKAIFLLLAGLWAVSGSCLAQNEGGFTGYGEVPVKTPDSFFRKINLATDVKTKILAVQPLLAFHAAHGTTDSVILYAQQLIATLNQNGLSAADKLSYQVSLYLTLANAYSEEGLYDEALRFYLQGIGIAESLGNKAAVNENKLGMANVYAARSEYDKAITTYNDLLNTGQDERLKYLVYERLGMIFLQRRDLFQAKQYTEKALIYFQQQHQEKKVLQAKLTLGIIAEFNQQAEEAYSIYNEVKDNALQHQFFDLYISAGQRMGDLLISRKEYDNAKVLLSLVYANALQWNDAKAQLKALNSLRNLHAVTGDYKNAYALMTQYLGISQDVLNKQNKKEINELEIKYQTAQKEKEILNKENELNHQKTIKYSLLIGFLVILLPVIGLLYMYYQKLQAQSKLNATMEEMNRQKIAALLKDKELELLKASVSGQEKERKRIAGELHDSIGGNLAAIKLQLSNQTDMVRREALIRQVDDTYHQVRDLSHDLVPQKFSNTGFTELIAAYIRQFNVPGNAIITFQAFPSEEIDRIGTSLKVEIYKIIQELITNAQKHSQASKVEIQLTQLDGILKLLFEDDGRGFSPETAKYGIGFQNIRERLQLFDGVLSIDAFPSKGTVIDIEIPLKPECYEA